MDEIDFGRAADPLFVALDLIASPVFVIDLCPDGRFATVHVNRAYPRDSADPPAPKGACLDEVFPARTARALTESYRTCLERGCDTFDELLCLFGTERWWRTTLSLVEPPAGMTARIVGISSDITDLKARTTTLAHEIAEACAENRELHTLAALTAHDLRGPLANIVSLTDLVLDGFRDFGDGKRDLIQACGEVAETSLGAISQIMGRIADPLPGSPARVPIDIAQICRQLSALADPGGRLRISHPVASIESDDIVLHLGLRNLIDNAARYATTRIEIGLEAAGEGCIALIVADDGPGFAPGADPVSRAAARAAGLRDTRGFGLGAVIRLVACRGGELAAIRSPLGGAAMRLTLPGRILHEARDLSARRSA